MDKKRNVVVDYRMKSTNKQTNKNGKVKYSSKSVSNSSIKDEDGSSLKTVSSNRVKGEKARFKSASVRFDENGNISGNFTRGEKGKYISGPSAERKFNRWDRRLNR
jgi:hypothetical protein